MRVLAIVVAIFLVGCGQSENKNGRYQLIDVNGFQFYRLDTRTGEVVYQNALPRLNEKPSYETGTPITVMPPEN